MKATPTAQSGIQTATQKAKARLLSKTVYSMKPRRLFEVMASETDQRPHSSLRNRAKKRLCMFAGKNSDHPCTISTNEKEFFGIPVTEIPDRIFTVEARTYSSA